MTDQEQMALCAIRYTIGRMSYVVCDGQRWAREWGAKSEWVRSVLIRDLEEEVMRESHAPGALGDTMDSKGWHSVLNDLRAMNSMNGNTP